MYTTGRTSLSRIKFEKIWQRIIIKWANSENTEKKISRDYFATCCSVSRCFANSLSSFASWNRIRFDIRPVVGDLSLGKFDRIPPAIYLQMAIAYSWRGMFRMSRRKVILSVRKSVATVFVFRSKSWNSKILLILTWLVGSSCRNVLKRRLRQIYYIPTRTNGVKMTDPENT